MADTPANIDSEIWKDIPGWEGFYQASSLGRIRSLDRVVTRASSHRGGYKFLRRGRVLSPSLHRKQGYLKVCLRDGASQKTPYVHSLVCRTFHGRRPDKHDVAHGDGDKTNNRADNLRWATRKENVADRWLHGSMIFGENSPSAKRTEDQVISIRAMSSAGMRNFEIAKAVGVDSRRVSEIVRRKKWAYLE